MPEDEIKKVGRPKKQPPKEPVTESSERLEMSKKESAVGVETVINSLNRYYNRVLGTNGKNYVFDGCSNLQKYNPFLQNQRLKQLSTQPTSLSRDNLGEILNAPQNAEQPLRGQGWSLSSSQYLYYKILRLAADVPKFKYYKVPELLKSSEYGSEKFINEDKFVENWLKTFDVVNTLKKVALDVKREGKPTYILRNCVTRDSKMKKAVAYAKWQKLQSDYVKLTGIGEHGYIASFNMLIFLNPAICLDQFPDFIRDIWEDMVTKGAISRIDSSSAKKSGKTYQLNTQAIRNYSYNFNGIEDLKGVLELKDKSYYFWVSLPQDLCYTFCSDTSHPWAIPDTAGLFLGLKELTDYDQLAGLLQSTPLTALLTAEMETVPNPNPGQDQTVMSIETIASFQERFNTAASNNIDGFFAPLKNFKLLSLPNVPNSSETTTNATKNFVYRAGLGGLLITTDKPSVTQVKTAQMLEEAEADFVTKQFESVINMIINKLLGCEYEWRVILWGNIFSFADEVKRDKELWQSGATFVLPKLASAYDISLRDTRALESYIESLDIYKDFKTVTQVKQEEINEKKENLSNLRVGRPEKSEEEIDNDNTAASKDGGLDTSDTKEFSFKEYRENHKCIICGQDTDGTLICEECSEEYEEEKKV